MTRFFTSSFLAVALVLTAFSTQGHATAFGTLSNFDVVNDTGHECHGFEIELEDCHPGDVPYTFGDTYIRYGTPEVLDTTVDPAHPRVLVRYRHWNGSQWEATPVAPAGVTPGGHDCYSGGPIGNYLTSGCEHYGVSLNVNPSKTTYRWLVAGNPADVGSVFSVEPQAVQIPVPVWNVIPQPVVGGIGAPVDVRAEVEPIEEGNAAQYGPAQWMKVFKVESDRQLQPADLNLLLLGLANGIVPGEAEVETEWKLIQSKPGNAEGDQEDADVKNDPLGAGKHSVVRRYEFYGYTGPHDPENNEAFPCVNDGAPVAADAPVDGCADLGDFVGAQNVAVDVELATADADLAPGEVGVPYVGAPVAFGGVPPYVITLTDGALPDGLALDHATGALVGTPMTQGTFGFSIHAEDHVLAVIDGTFTITIVPAVTIETLALAAAEVDQCYYEVVGVVGGLDPYVWSDISGQLPGWASTSDNRDVGGCPTAGDEGVSHLSFMVTDALGGKATKALDLVVTGPQPIATETPVPVATETPVPTATATATPVPTATATRTPVPTVTATVTALPTATQTPVPTATATPVPSATQTPVKTATPTPVATAVAGTLKIKNDELEDGDLGHRYSDTLQLSKAGAPPYAWTATGLPSGLVLNATRGIISGRPLVVGRFVVLISVSDANGNTGAKTLRLKIK